MAFSSAIKAQWQTLINDAQFAAGIQLEHYINDYLIHTLIHYTQRTDIVKRIFALDYLKANQTKGYVRINQLRELADQCLLYAGLFPQYAKRHNLKANYYIDLGRSAYSDLANNNCTISGIFSELSSNFIGLMDTLLAIHCINDDKPAHYILDPLHALHIWQSTKSTQALKIFQQQTHSSNIVDFRLKNTAKKLQH